MIEKIRNDLKDALLKKDKKKASAIRLLLSDIKNAEIDKGEPLDDQEVIQRIKSVTKKWKNAVEQFEKAGDLKRVESEKKDIETISVYLPEQLSEEEIERIVVETIAEVEAEDMKDMGKVMKAVMSKTQGSVDGKIVNEIVKSKLSG